MRTLGGMQDYEKKDILNKLLAHHSNNVEVIESSSSSARSEIGFLFCTLSSIEEIVKH